MRKLLLCAIPLLLLSSCLIVPTVPRDRVILGERAVDFHADHDVIQVGAYEGFFRSLLFVVEKNDIELFNFQVTYGNGEKEKFTTRLVLREGSRSRVLALTGGKRRIETIAFTYKTVGNWLEGRARVVVYGVR